MEKNVLYARALFGWKLKKKAYNLLALLYLHETLGSMNSPDAPEGTPRVTCRFGKVVCNIVFICFFLFVFKEYLCFITSQLDHRFCPRMLGLGCWIVIFFSLFWFLCVFKKKKFFFVSFVFQIFFFAFSLVKFYIILYFKQFQGFIKN